MALAPSTRPRQTREETQRILVEAGVTAAVCLLGVRGYYRDTMGAPGRNDRGIYDDALFLFAPEAFAAFNANTDPSITRPGMAVLRTGLWKYKVGTHGLSKPKHLQYTALVQAEPVTVRRDGRGDDTGLFGINIHRGGVNTTSSAGCQTIVPAQWPAFIALVQDALRRHGQKVLPYLLTEHA